MDKLLILAVALLSHHIVGLPFGVVIGAKQISPCSKTPYPELCSSLIHTKSLKTLDKTEFPLHESAIKATLNQAHQAHTVFSTMDVSSFSKQAKLAWADCLELYDDSIYQLSRSIASNDPFSVQTWLSAATTNHQTCQNGFNEFNESSHLQSFTVMLSDFTKYLSNSLAINKAVTSFSASTKNNRNRRLLADGFPEWISTSQRKLLQSSGGPAEADIVVAQDGSGNYKTISEAVAAAAKQSGSKRFVIYVKGGVYKENIEISRSMKNIMFVGDGMDATIVTGNKHQPTSTTYSSATFGISGDGFMARDMTFENTAGPASHQAVALRSGSDYSVFYKCSFKGYQDTLYVYAQRQFYRECEIYGTQDFICGNAAVIFQNSKILVRKPLSYQFNAITAQSRTDPNQNTGIIIHNSIVTAASDLKSVQGSYKTYLGRPWQKYSRTVYMKCSLDSLIAPAGWTYWIGNFGLSTLYYGEYMNTGGGAGTSGRVKWPGYHAITSATEAEKFTVGNFLAGGGWISASGVPVTTGL